MNGQRRRVLVTAAVAAMMFGPASAHAARYRIYFEGNEALARQSATNPMPLAAAPLPRAQVVPPPPTQVPAVPQQAAQAPAARPAGYYGVAATAAVPVAPAGPACNACPPTGCQMPPNHGAGVPNQIVTFLHPFTNQAITVPLTLPVGKPTLVTRSDRIIYNYGLFSYKVIVRFLPDGRVAVTYRG